MKQITVKIPESFTGSHLSVGIALNNGFDEFRKKMESLFPISSSGKKIREPYAEPDIDSAAIDLECWQFNEELCKLS